MSLLHIICSLSASYLALMRVSHSCSGQKLVHVQKMATPACAILVCSHFYHVVIYNRPKPIGKGNVEQGVQHCYIIAAVYRRCKPCSLALGDQLM